MSSPIAIPSNCKGWFKNALVFLHQRLSHKNRVRILSDTLAAHILHESMDHKKVKCLDIGCGDMSIVENIVSIVHKTNWQCIDIHTLPDELNLTRKWLKYLQFDGQHLPFDDNSFDIVLLCDVLHHANGNLMDLLKEAQRVGKIVIIKDQVEYSLYSRIMMMVMEFVGNWAYGVELPYRFFTLNSFRQYCINAGLELRRLDIGIRLYNHLPLFKHLLRPEWHFVAVATASNNFKRSERI